MSFIATRSLVVGPTGSGKTAALRNAAKCVKSKVTIADAKHLPENVLHDDPKLLMWCDQAITRMGGGAIQMDMTSIIVKLSMKQHPSVAQITQGEKNAPRIMDKEL